jgi:hypothetical protein
VSKCCGGQVRESNIRYPLLSLTITTLTPALIHFIMHLFDND